MFYLLATDEGKKKKFAYATSVVEWPRKLVSCAFCKREWEKSLMHEYGINDPLVLINENFPYFAWYYIELLSEKAKNILESEGITGVTFEEATILSRDSLTASQIKELKIDGIKTNAIPNNPPRYYKMHVSIGATFHENTDIILQESCNICGYEIYITAGKGWVDPERQKILKGESIAGYDLFMAKGYGENIFCTEKFLEIYNKHDMTGLLFRKVEVL